MKSKEEYWDRQLKSYNEVDYHKRNSAVSKAFQLLNLSINGAKSLGRGVRKVDYKIARINRVILNRY